MSHFHIFINNFSRISALPFRDSFDDDDYDYGDGAAAAVDD